MPVLLLIMAAGPLPLFAISALAPTLTAELGMSRAQLGALPAVAFALAALVAWRGGRATDVVSARSVSIGVSLTALAALVAVAVSRSLTALLVAAVFAGLSISLANPVTNSAVGQFVPISRRGVVTGVKQSGVQVGQVVAGTVVPATALLLGWRGAVALLLLAPLVGLLLAITTLPGGRGESPRAAARVSTGTSTRRTSGIRLLSAYTLVVAAAVQSTGVYASLYAFERVGLGASAAGATVGAVGAAGVVARVVLGRAVDRWTSLRTTLVTLAAGAAAAAGAFLAAEHVGPPLLWVAAVAFGSSALAANAIVMVAVLRTAEEHEIGQATGVVSVGMYVGFAIGPALFGALVQTTGTYAAGWSMVMVLCLVAAVVATRLPSLGAGPGR